MKHTNKIDTLKKTQQTAEMVEEGDLLSEMERQIEDAAAEFARARMADKLRRIPEAGTLSPELEKRVLDFGVTDSYAEASAPWELH